jgi:hypothetical protein
MHTHVRRHADRQDRRLIATFIVFPLMGAPCALANGAVADTRVSSAQPAQNIGPLLLKLEQQIAAEHVALPKSDNASETWLLVIAKAYPATPETRLALANFATHALERATAERAAGKEVAATEFQVFANLATDLLTRKDAQTTSSESPAASDSAGTPQVSSRSAAPETGSANVRVPQSVDTASPPHAAQPNRGNEAPPLGSPNASGANATRPLMPTSPPALTVAPGHSAPAAVLHSASADPDRGNGAPPLGGPDASRANATRPLIPTSPAALTVAPGPSAPAAVLRSASTEPDRGNVPPPLGRPDASGAHTTRPLVPTSPAALTVAHGPSLPAALLHSASADPSAGNPTHSTALMGQTRLAALPAATPIRPLPTIQDQSLATLYVTRGDQMMAIKDVSAARRLYEYAANAGSARAAAALARTFDPSFLSRLGVVGLKPDPALAAVWYGKAAALGDRDAKTLLHNLSTEAAK